MTNSEETKSSSGDDVKLADYSDFEKAAGDRRYVTRHIDGFGYVRIQSLSYNEVPKSDDKRFSSWAIAALVDEDGDELFTDEMHRTMLDNLDFAVSNKLGAEIIRHCNRLDSHEDLKKSS